MEKEFFFTIVVEKNAQIKNMEQGIEALLKEKEQWEAVGASIGTSTVAETLGITIFSESIEELTIVLDELSADQSEKKNC